MFKTREWLHSIKSWKEVETERLKASGMDKTENDHIWIARVWTNNFLDKENLLFSVPFDTRKQVRNFKVLTEASRAKYKVTYHRIDMDGEYMQ